MKRDMSDEEIDLAKAQDDRWKMLKAKGTPTTEDYNQRLNDLYKRYGITADKQSGGMSMQMDETERPVQEPVKAKAEPVKQPEKKATAVVSKEQVKKPVSKAHKNTTASKTKTQLAVKTEKKEDKPKRSNLTISTKADNKAEEQPAKKETVKATETQENLPFWKRVLKNQSPTRSKMLRGR